MPRAERAHAISTPEYRSDGHARGFSARCSCGWESELCPTEVFALAAAEQHLELARPDQDG